jgi:hypothetical protein
MNTIFAKIEFQVELFLLSEVIKTLSIPMDLSALAERHPLVEKKATI